MNIPSFKKEPEAIKFAQVMSSMEMNWFFYVFRGQGGFRVDPVGLLYDDEEVITVYYQGRTMPLLSQVQLK